MELDKRQWYVRWFFWSMMVWDEFRQTDTSWRYEEGTNVCHFIRVLLVWTPFVLGLHVIVYGSGIAVLTVLPIYLYGGVGYAWIIGVIAFVVGLIFAIKSIGRKIRERNLRRSAKPTVEKIVAPTKTTAPKGPGFFEVLWTYVVAAKKKVCPTITFNDKTSGDA